MESNMIFVAISRLYQVFGDPMKVGWLITAFTLMSAASAAMGGRLVDLFGRRLVLLIVMIIGLGGSLLSALTNDLNIVLIGRVLQGTTTAALPLCFGILREHLPAWCLRLVVASSIHVTSSRLRTVGSARGCFTRYSLRVRSGRLSVRQ